MRKKNFIFIQAIYPMKVLNPDSLKKENLILTKFVIMLMKSITAILFSFVGLVSARAQPVVNIYPQQKKVECSHAAVVSAHPLATKAGLQILKAGGNAIDAAIATQLALAVVYPGAGNIGGGGFLVAHLKSGKNITIDYREKAPAKANRDMYLDSAGNPQLNLSQDGHLAAGVPGTIAGLFASLKYARLPFSKLIQPAIDLAWKGFPITKAQAASLNLNKENFIRLNTSGVAFVKDTPWQEGDVLVQKQLANTLKRIGKFGQKGFYEGETAKLIVDEMQKGRGIISYDDLKAYKAIEREPMEFDYRDAHIITMPLPSSGGIILQQMMKMVAQKNIATKKFLSPEAVHLMVEAERRAFADRAEFLGDPDFVKMPLSKLTSESYLMERMKDYDSAKAGNSIATKAGIIKESEETTHISIIDDEGNAASVTTTLNGSYGSKTVVTGAGFLLNNEMDDFSIKPGVPNMYGAVGNEKNAIAPGKRMLSSMTPTIVLKKNKPFMIVGSPGGTTIPTSVFQSLIDILDFGLNPEDAVNGPKFHHQWLPDVVYVEATFPDDTANKLELMGYKIGRREPIGRTELILVNDRKKNHITAIADHRGDDAAAGY
jgi:gamma-glutamyltranspeptidase/glutathione hydrolase